MKRFYWSQKDEMTSPIKLRPVGSAIVWKIVGPGLEYPKALIHRDYGFHKPVDPFLLVYPLFWTKETKYFSRDISFTELRGLGWSVDRSNIVNDMSSLADWVGFDGDLNEITLTELIKANGLLLKGWR